MTLEKFRKRAAQAKASEKATAQSECDPIVLKKIDPGSIHNIFTCRRCATTNVTGALIEAAARKGLLPELFEGRFEFLSAQICIGNGVAFVSVCLYSLIHDPFNSKSSAFNFSAIVLAWFRLFSWRQRS